MKQPPIKLAKGQYISDIEPFKTHGIPTNTIIHKEITGCGITRYEIEFAKHHSIIILPNVPVIQGKVKEHNHTHPKRMEVLGVYKGVDVIDIKLYLAGEAEFKKILTTPEGFITKVTKAFAENPLEMYNGYFLLYDECERIITDISYRGAIAAPLDEFFKFTNKALVSATTLAFSDERFESFDLIKIEPTYDYSKQLKLLTTNNIVASLKQHLDAIESDHVCVFFNSTNGIAATVKTLKIEGQSKVYCSQESVLKLKVKGYSHATSDLEVRSMGKYNFFTSRYFSAVDIKLDYKPDVIMVTDVYFADHSILDPQTECIQIAGRFRNGVKTLTHITNFNPALDAKGEDETRYYLQGCFDTYNWFVRNYESAVHPGSKDMFKSAIDASPVNNFYLDGKLNNFMIDNAIQDERVKGYYQHNVNLMSAYSEINNHFKMEFVNEDYRWSDAQLFNLHNKQGQREEHRTVAGLFNHWTNSPGHFVFPPIEMLNHLTARYPKIAEAHDWIGLEGLEETGYVPSKIAKAVKDAKEFAKLKQLAPLVYARFEEFHTYINEFILLHLTEIYRSKGITTQVRVSFISKFFVTRRTTEQGKHAYRLQHKLL